MDDLQALANTAAAADQGAMALDAPPPVDQSQGAPVPGAPDYASEAEGMVGMFCAFATGFAPAAEGIWTEGARKRTAEALTPVLAKYQVSLGGLPVELVFAITAGPLLWQTSKAVAMEMNAKKREAEAKQLAHDKPQDQRAPAPLDGAAPAPLVHPQMALYPQGGAA